MFIAMNRFHIVRGHEEEFERVWKTRDTQLKSVPGFVEFHLLRGPAADDYTLYASHTVWASQKDFENWTTSESFRLAHRSAGEHKHMYLGPPRFEGFSVVQQIK